MEQSTIVVLVMAGICQMIILYLIIAIATKADKRAKYAWAQLELLRLMAKQQGVSDADMQPIFTEVNKK